MSHEYSFRCKHCSHLSSSENAGECAHPHACQVCGRGVVFERDKIADAMMKDGITKEELIALANKLRTTDPAAKEIDPSNWEHLHECSPERLKELGIEAHQVKKHQPFRNVFKRGADRQTEFVHNGTDSEYCHACRHGAQLHVEGKREMLNLPTHEVTHHHLDKAIHRRGVGIKVHTAEGVGSSNNPDEQLTARG